MVDRMDIARNVHRLRIHLQRKQVDHPQKRVERLRLTPRESPPRSPVCRPGRGP
jgi:hypothetical protein